MSLLLASIRSRKPRLKRSALTKESGAWNAATSTPGCSSPALEPLGGHQTDVPGTCASSIGSVRVEPQMPCSSDRPMPIATPVSIGRTTIAIMVIRISANSTGA